MTQIEIHLEDEYGERIKPQQSTQSTEKQLIYDLKSKKNTFNQFLDKVVLSEKKIFENLVELKKNKYVEDIYIKYNENGNVEFHGSLTPLGKGKFSKNYYALLGGVRTYDEDILELADAGEQKDSRYKNVIKNKRLEGASIFETKAYVIKENKGEYEIKGVGLTKAVDYISEKRKYLKNLIGIKE